MPARRSFTGAALFAGLEEAVVRTLVAAATRRSVAPEEVLFLQGEPVAGLFLIDEGLLRLVQHTADGREVVLRTLGPDEIVAGIALLAPRTYPVTALGQTACSLLMWPRPRIQELARQHPVLRTNVLATIADRMQDSLAHIRELSTETAPQRVARALERLVQGLEGNPGARRLPLGRQELADMAGVSMYTASRLLAAWSRAGIVDVGRRRMAVLDPERLRDIAAGAGDPS